uniref:Uncharacterized protein n=1 Tax=Prymnesium polylepis TaxID=72548 RepID=A0A6T7ZUA9_9EUKA|mmetsp:Transcript_29327/g.72086  ORF Transcript_29327/g.72086 Transcript_29327/m.72086 type:complete len:126 (+) Transcript_29327:17-394(+)
MFCRAATTLLVLATLGLSSALRVPLPGTQLRVQAARCDRVHMEASGPDLTNEEAAALQKAEAFEAEVLAAREASRASTVTSFSSFQTKAVSLVIVLAVFAFALSVFDPNNCTFLAPIKEVCIDYS